MVILCGAIVGLRASGRVCLRYKKLLGFYLFTEEISERMMMGEELRKIYAGEKAKGLIRVSGYSAEVISDGLLNEDIELLRNFFGSLGMCELDAAVKSCAVLSELLLKKVNDAEEQMRTKSRLYSALGLFGGIFAALILV